MKIVMAKEDITLSMIHNTNNGHAPKNSNNIIFQKGVKYRSDGTVVYTSKFNETSIFTTKNFTKFFLKLDTHRDNIINELLNDNSKTN